MRPIILCALLLSLSACESRDSAPRTSDETPMVQPGDSSGAVIPPPPQAQTKYGVSSGIIEYRNEWLDRVQTFYFDRYGAREAIYTGKGGRDASDVPFDVSIYAGGTKVNYSSATRQGVRKIQPNAAGPLLGSVPDLRPLRLMSLGTRTIVGKPTEGVALVSEDARMNLWMWRGIPLEIDEFTADGDTIRMRATSIAIDVAIPAERFQVPKGIALNQSIEQ